MADGNRGYVIPPRYWAWLGTRRAAVVLMWAFAVGTGAYHFWHAREWFGKPDPVPERRRPGNGGHVYIDFGGQWVMGRMLVLGRGRELYHRQRQWEVVAAGYPAELEPPFVRAEKHLPPPERRFAQPGEELRGDAGNLMYWFMGADSPQWKAVGGAAAAPLAAADPFTAAALTAAAADRVTPEVVADVTRPAVGGPLYPPVHAFLYSPVGLFADPRDAYLAFQCVALGLAYAAGLGVSVLTRGRVWWSAASAGVLFFPGGRAGIDLGQNPTLTLTILVWGWVLAARGREWAGGAVWGLFAFKPVWGLAFAVVPVLMGRWRFCAAMAGTGLGLAAATLPVVGVQTWRDWLAVGREAAELYNVNHNWIMLSRDLHGIPRRVLHDFARPEKDRDTPLARALAWGLWGAVFVTTAAVYRLRADRRKATGLGAGFLFLGAFLTCYRFMYYDVLLAAMAYAVLFAELPRFFRTRTFAVVPVPDAPLPPRPAEPPAGPPPPPLGPRLVGYVNSLPLTVLAALYLWDNLLIGLDVEATVGVRYFARPVTGADGATATATPRLQGDTSLNYPWDTALLLVLWAWCAVRVWRGDDRAAAAGG